MLNYLKAFSVFLLWAFIALTSHYYLNNTYFNYCNLDNKASSKENVFKKKLFLITDTSNKIIYSSPEGFTISKNNYAVSNVKIFPNLIDSIQHFLMNDYTKELHISGKYLQSEIKNTQHINLGLQRAKFLRQELIRQGIDSSKIKIFGEISNFSYKNNIFNNGIEMNFNTLRQNKIDSIEFKITHKTLYVEFVNGSLVLTKDLIKYTHKLKFYLQKYSIKKVTITGHTDNLGYFDKNLIIGLNNANKLKDYFIKKGIDSAKIETFSKGESKPIADKTTEKGRTLNKRIELKIN
ncbi:MAG: OmpA family protein [Lutibacter sp.]|uniref:OmpA family protein n=1 Tax=Lutibacter sp. TaxID=1925666 RepID=UPI00385F7AE5